jgi:hypothetical protein
MFQLWFINEFNVCNKLNIPRQINKPPAFAGGYLFNKGRLERVA